eukprot:g27452.t1
MTDAQLRDFNVARVDRTTAINNGRWAGSYDLASDWPDRAWRSDPKPSEKLVVPEFDGEGINDTELGRSARSYVRRVQVWLRCTKMPPEQRALALYTALTGKAWVYAEELDVDLLAMDTGVSYFLEWIQTRFMEVELTKISGIMNELFRKCRRRTDQSVRDFNVEFERLVLRLHEVRCELPPLIKGWLYLDKLRLSEAEELALLSSVNNTYDVRRLQQAALVQDRSLRRPSSNHAEPEKKPWGKRWTGRQSVHLTYHDETSEEEDEGGEEGDGELVDEETACQQHTAYMAYQGAKAKYREALRGRGADVEELKKRSDERLKLAKLRSYCSACKRKGHWHRDPECPMRGQSSRPVRPDDKSEGGKQMQSAQMCQVVYLTEVSGVTGRGCQSFNLEDHVGTGGAVETFVPKAEIGEPSEIVESFVLDASEGNTWLGGNCIPCQFYNRDAEEENKWQGSCFMTSMEKASELQKPVRGCNGLLAIVDTACTKSVAGHDWFEEYADWAAEHGYQVVTSDHQEHFRFGASKVYVSTFLVRAWFAIRSRFFQVDVSIVPCSVPLLFSRPVLADLGMLYDVATEEVDLQALHLQKVKLWTSESGHPALWASDCGDKAIPDTLPPKRDGELHFAAEEAYMSAPVQAKNLLLHLRDTASRAAKAAAQREAEEKAAKEAAEKAAAEKAAKEAAEREAAEKAAKEAAERLAAEMAAREAAERIAAEMAAIEAAERMAAEMAAIEAAEREAAEMAAREAAAAEMAAIEAAERMAAELAAIEVAERMAAEMAAIEAAEREAAEMAARQAAEQEAAAAAAAEAASAKKNAEREAAEMEARESRAAALADAAAESEATGNAALAASAIASAAKTEDAPLVQDDVRMETPHGLEVEVQLGLPAEPEAELELELGSLERSQASRVRRWQWSPEVKTAVESPESEAAQAAQAELESDSTPSEAEAENASVASARDMVVSALQRLRASWASARMVGRGREEEADMATAEPQAELEEEVEPVAEHHEAVEIDTTEQVEADTNRETPAEQGEQAFSQHRSAFASLYPWQLLRRRFQAEVQEALETEEAEQHQVEEEVDTETQAEPQEEEAEVEANMVTPAELEALQAM